MHAGLVGPGRPTIARWVSADLVSLGYQYLRMLFGADTTKPDVHICRFVCNTLNPPLSDVGVLDMLEQAGPLAGVKVRDVDTTIWEMSARGARRSRATLDQRRAP